MITLAAATFLRAWQQQNVIHGYYYYYYWAFLTSFGMALANVMVIVGVVNYGMAVIPFIGTGGAIGVVSAMYLHRRLKQ